MVATVKLFNCSVYDTKAIGEITGYYFDHEMLGYYASTSASPGTWFGGGIEHLGLAGEVRREDLFHLLRGRDPVTHKPLVRLQKKTADLKREEGQDRAGLDVSFSVPKSVSALWAFSSEERRRIIERCVMSAVQQTLTLIEENCLTVRSGKGGCEWSKGKLIFALFQHFIARNNNDFQLHVHCVAPNIVVTEDGKTRKINTKALLPFIRIAGPLFRNTVLAELTRELGVRAFIPKHGKKESEWFELEGLPQKFLRKFSSRKQEIEEQVAAFGYSNASAAATQSANFATRKSKGEEPPLDALEAQWQIEAKKLGVTKETFERLVGHTLAPITEKDIEVAIKQAISKITEHDAVFDRWMLIRKTSELLQDRPITGAEVIERVDQHLRQDRDLFLSEVNNGHAIYSTQELARMERETIECVDKMASTPGVAIPAKFIEQAIKRSTVTLSDEQEKCIRGVLTADASIASITGHAGAGKTTILKVIVDAYELAGKTVIGTSLGGVAVEKIRDSINRESRTLASFLHEFKQSPTEALGKAVKHQARMFARAARKKSTWKRLTKKPVDKDTVILADESGMIDLLTMYPFVTEVQRRGASLILIGDGLQLQPVGPGNPLEHVNVRVGTHELKKNWRQTAEEARASLNVREGNAKDALQIYADKGDLVVTTNRSDIIKRLVDDWFEQSKADPSHAIVIARTNKEVDLLNALCQAARIKDGQIHGGAVEVNERSIHKGDRVIFRKKDSLLGVENGYRGTVLSIGEDGSLTIRIDGKSSAASWKERLREGVLNTSQLDKSLIKITQKQASKLDLRLGYASTTHSYQGSQADYVFVLLGGRSQDRHLSYVQLSRSVKRSRLYVDRMHAGPEFKSIIASMNKENIKQNVYSHRPTHEHSHKWSTES